MKKCFKKALSGILASAMLFSSVAFTPVSVSAAGSMTAGGWFETIYAEISGISAADVASVTYSGTTSNSLSSYDLQYLVRDKDGKVRIDVPGLSAGDNYTITVKTTDGETYTQSGIKVYEYDRTGYAHYDADKAGGSSAIGVGGYKDNGELKDNAVVVYVTEENKNTVQVPGYVGDQYPMGIGNILNEKSTDEGGSNQGASRVALLKQLNADNKSLVVRFVGTVTGGTSDTNDNPPAENILGLTQYNGTGNGGTKKDNGMMARMYKGSNITIEGIGTDATIDGWGFQVIAQTDWNCEGFEFRNLHFVDTPEDAIGLEGTSDSSSNPQSKEWITSPIKYCWVHNNTFEMGYCKNPADDDKAEGDGSVDFKRGYGYTMSYNHYRTNHKTNLIGSSDTSIQYDVTFHHNYYEGVWSRQPLARQANIHIYNSYFLNGENTSYIISPRAHAYIFSEANYYDRCKNPVDEATKGAVVKSLNDNFAGCNGNNSATIVSSKSEVVKSDNPYANFENSNDMYEYTVTDAAQAKADCLAKAGIMPEAANINMDPQPESIITQYPSGPISLTYEVNFKDSEVVSALKQGQVNDYKGALITPASKLSTSTGMKIRDNGIVFKVNTDVDIAIALGSSSKYGLDIVNEYGVAVKHLDGSGTVIDLEPGTYIIRSGNVEKDAYVESIKIAQHDPNGTTIEVPTQATTSSSEVTTNGEGGSEPTTSGSVSDSGYMMHEDGVDASGIDVVAVKSAIYDFEGSYKSAKGTYNGITYDRGYKIESKTSFIVDAPADGVLQLVTGNASNIKVDGTEVTLTSGSGLTLTEIPMTQGEHVITRGDNECWIYLLNYVPEGSGDEDTDDSSSTTTTEGQTESTTEASTEGTTAVPVEGVNVSVGKATVNVGESITVPVKVTGLDTLANYDIDLMYDDTKLEVTGVTNGNMIDVTDDSFRYNISEPGYIEVSAINDDTIKSGDVLFNVTFTGVAEGTSSITLIVNELFAANSAEVEYTVDNGNVTVADSSKPSTGINGDVDKDGDVDAKDAAIVLKIASGIITNTAPYDTDAANYNGDTKIDVLDAVAILKAAQGGSEEPTETTTEGTATTPGEPQGGKVTKALVAGANDDVLPGLVAGEAMALDTENNGDYVQGTNNPKTGAITANGTIPDSGAYIAYTAPADGTFTTFIKTNKNKTTYFLDSTGEAVHDPIIAGETSSYDTVDVNVKAGQTIYVYTSGSKACFFSFVFTPYGATEEPTETTTEGTVITPGEPQGGKVTKALVAGANDDVLPGLVAGEAMALANENNGDYVQGTNNPKTGAATANGTIPDSGAYIAYTAPADGTFTTFIKTNKNKTTYFLDSTGEAVHDPIIAGETSSYDTVDVNVKAGQTIYIYTSGSKACFFSFIFTPGSAE